MRIYDDPAAQRKRPRRQPPATAAKRPKPASSRPRVATAASKKADMQRKANGRAEGVRAWDDARQRLIDVAISLLTIPPDAACHRCRGVTALVIARCVGCLFPGPCYLCAQCDIRQHGPRSSWRRHAVERWDGEQLVTEYPHDPSAAEDGSPGDSALDGAHCSHAHCMHERATVTNGAPLSLCRVDIGQAFSSCQPFRDVLRRCVVPTCDACLVERLLTVHDLCGESSSWACGSAHGARLTPLDR